MFYLEVVSFAGVSFGLLLIIACVNPEGSGRLAAVSRFFVFTLPDAVFSVVNRFVGQERLEKIRGCVFYVFEKPNPCFQILYLVLSVGGYFVFYFYGFQFLPNPFVPALHMYVGSFLYFVALTTFVMASLNSPGQVKKDNLEVLLKNFQYDNVMFSPRDCSICKIQKPARSKHCKICGFCVSKMDHHCIWINQCVGHLNYKYFLSFILSHSLICLYAGQVGYYIFLHISYKEKLWSANFFDGSGNRVQSGLLVIFQVLLRRYTLLMFIVILCFVIGFTLAGFFVYHLILLRKNLTSREKVKIWKLEERGKNPNHSFYNKGFFGNFEEVIEAEA
jgi:palmitoyltransferase